MTATVEELRYQFSAEFGELDRAFAKVRNTAKKLGDDTSRAFGRGERAADSFNNKLGGLRSSIASLSGVFAAMGAALVTGGIFNVNKEFQDLQSSLKTVLGSASEAESAFNRIKAFASSTPYAVKELTDGFIKMGSLGLKPSEDLMRSFGNTASAMGKGFDQMIEAVADAASSEFERLKEFGIKAKQQGDKVSLTFQGVTTTIGNNSKEIVAYLASIGDVNFGGAMAEKMTNLSGLASNLGDKIDNLFVQIGEAGANELFSSALIGMGQTIDFFANNLDTVGAVLAGVAAGIGTIFVPAILGAITAIKSLTIAMAANPIGLIAVGIAAAVTAIITYKDEIASLAEYTDLIVDVVKTAWDEMKIAMINSVIEAVSNMAASFATIPDIMQAVSNSILIGFKTGVVAASQVISGLVSFVKDKFSAMGSYITSFITDPFGDHKLDAGGGIEKYMKGASAAIKAGGLEIKSQFAAVGKEFTQSKNNFEKLLGGKAKSNVTGTNRAGSFSEIFGQAKARDQRRKSQENRLRIQEEALAPVIHNEATDEALKKTSANLQELTNKAGGAKKALKGSGGGAAETSDELKNFADRSQELIGGIKEATKGLFTDIFKNGKSVFEALSNFVSRIMDKIMDMLLDSALDGLFLSIGNSSGGGFLSGIFGSLFGGGGGGAKIAGARKHGGRVTGGKLYQVNEAGVELFSPHQSGIIHPAHRVANMANKSVGGGGIANVQINISRAPENMRVKQDGNNINIDFEEMAEKIEDRIAKNIGEGNSPIPAAFNT